MKAELLVISGRVQGVGYRDWLVAEATRLQLTGWVRNLGRDRVEALVHGEAAAIEALVELCRVGPRWASVTDVLRRDHEPVEHTGFRRIASAPA